MTTSHNISVRYSIAAAATFALLFIGFNTLLAAWTPAPANPPSSNTAAPIDTSSVAQTKLGALTTNEFNSDEYCNKSKSNCVPGNAIGTGIIYDIIDLGARGLAADNGHNNWSSRVLGNTLNVSGYVTYYGADSDTADYICRRHFNHQFGYWSDIRQPDANGWRPYSNLSIASFVPGQNNSRVVHCTSGTTCYNEGVSYGIQAVCYSFNRTKQIKFRDDFQPDNNSANFRTLPSAW